MNSKSSPQTVIPKTLPWRPMARQHLRLGILRTPAKHQLKHINDGNYGNSYSWISNEHGKGWVQLEFSKPETINRVEWARDREGKFADRLSIRYRIDASMDGQSWTPGRAIGGPTSDGCGARQCHGFAAQRLIRTAERTCRHWQLNFSNLKNRWRICASRGWCSQVNFANPIRLSF